VEWKASHTLACVGSLLEGALQGERASTAVAKVRLPMPQDYRWRFKARFVPCPHSVPHTG
jgi:hypothetical protein